MADVGTQLVASLRPHKQRGVHLRLSTLRHGCLVSLRRAPRPPARRPAGPDTRHIDVAADWSSDLESTLVKLLALDAERARQLVGQGAVWVAARAPPTRRWRCRRRRTCASTCGRRRWRRCRWRSARCAARATPTL